MSKLPDYVAYSGDVYQIEFYFSENGDSQSKEYMESMETRYVKKFAHLLQMLGDVGEIRNKEKFRYEGGKIYVFKPHPYRFLCFFISGNKVIITNGFRKKKQKLPVNEKERAVNMKRDYEERIKNGTYYEKYR